MVYKESAFIENVTKKLEETGKSKIEIKNVRFVENTHAIADVCYNWFLHAWEHRAEHISTVFVYRSGEWLSVAGLY